MPIHDTLTGDVIGAAIAVHEALGPGYLESVYENALTFELEIRGHRVHRQVVVPIHYRDHPVGGHRLDLVVNRELVVELKAVSALEDVHFAIVRSYLAATGLDRGLLLNFSRCAVVAKRVTKTWVRRRRRE